VGQPRAGGGAVKGSVRVIRHRAPAQ
jgi:hypothetical protein